MSRESVFPTQPLETELGTVQGEWGLSRLEYMATHIMAALMASEDGGHVMNRARNAVTAAGALLEALREAGQ